MARPVPQSTLDEVARLALDDDSAVVIRSTTTPLAGGAGNPSSAGVFRVAGVASTQDGQVSWSAVNKRMVNPHDERGFARPRNALYWRREADAYTAGLLTDLPGGLRAPRCFKVVTTEADRAELWMEDLGSMEEDWNGARRRAAVTHLAQFHAAYLNGNPVPGFPWMAMFFARQWYELLMPVAERAIAAVRGSGRHLVAPIAVLDDPSALLEVLESAPQTMCHHDTNPGNLQIRERGARESELIVIDWQLVGRGPVGEDLGQFLSTIVERAAPADRDRLESEVLAAYHSGLMAAGVRMTLPDVHRSYYCAATMRQVTFAFFLLGQQLAAATSRSQSQESVEAFIRATRHGHLPALAARARVLSGS